MSWTKKQLVEEAFADLALAGYVFDLTPDELQTALRRMDTMIATWDAKGIRIGYLLPSSPDTSDLDSPSGLPDHAVEAVYLNLAIRIAAGKGKMLPPQTLATAKDALDVLYLAAAQPRAQQLPGHFPLGAGNRRVRAFTRRPDTSILQVDDAGNLEILGG